MDSRGRLLVAGCLALLAGCGGKSAGTISFDADRISQDAMAGCDANKDGVLDSRELETCPSLKQALERFDRNRDGKLSATEIAERLAEYNRATMPGMPVTCEVRLDDRPLAGATVTFTPEPFLSGFARPATGVTDGQGTATLRTDDGAEVPLGLYRVSVSKKNGAETVPARYNASTVLGHEVAPDAREVIITFRLTSQ